MIPRTPVLKPGLVIHSIYNGYWFWGRPSFYDLWRDLRAATSEIRPDWDLSTPGLREAWAGGDRSHFHGWDRRSGEPARQDTSAASGFARPGQRAESAASGPAAGSQCDASRACGASAAAGPVRLRGRRNGRIGIRPAGKK